MGCVRKRVAAFTLAVGAVALLAGLVGCTQAPKPSSAAKSGVMRETAQPETSSGAPGAVETPAPPAPPRATVSKQDLPPVREPAGAGTTPAAVPPIAGTATAVVTVAPVAAAPEPPRPVPAPPSAPTQTTVVTVDRGVAPPAQPPPPRPEAKPVYSGPRSGTLLWSGKIDSGGTVTIDRDHCSMGTLMSPGLPGVPVTLDFDAREFALAEAPSPGNGWSKLVIRSRNKRHVSISLSWSVIP